MMNTKMIHYEWDDYIIISNNRIKRCEGSNDEGDVIFYNNIIEVKWDKWDVEYYLLYNNNYYIVDKNDNIYIDFINKILYNSSNNQYSNIKYINNSIEQEIIEDNNLNNIIIKDNINLTIPNIFHFIYGLLPQSEEFELYHYLAVKSAYDVNSPDKIYFYYYYEPYGYWWDKLDNIITKIKLSDEEYNIEINGQKVNHYAHKADIIRLKKINEIGGIYLDIDTICIKNFKDLLNNDFVMGIQGDEYGLCNAVILSKPNSFFSKKWLESYSTFRSFGRDEFWDEHSVKMPLELSKKYSQHIKILDKNAFFYPLWHDINNILFNNDILIKQKDIYINIITNNYCIHLWDTYSHDYLKQINENNIYSNNTLYNIIARKFLEQSISLVFLTYNRYDMTIECLNSYLQVLDKDYIKEMIILDNNSDKNLKDFLNNFQEKHPKIKIIFVNKNLGVCGGRRVLFKEATGTIIASLDSDAKLLNPIFFEDCIKKLYQEDIGIIGISGAFIRSWEFGSQIDITDDDENEYICHHIAGCCQIFRNDMKLFGIELDAYYDKFWVEDTDLSMQFLEIGKKNYRFNQHNRIKHNWGGSGAAFIELFQKNWNYFVNKWQNKIDLTIIP